MEALNDRYGICNTVNQQFEIHRLDLDIRIGIREVAVASALQCWGGVDHWTQEIAGIAGVLSQR